MIVADRPSDVLEHQIEDLMRTNEMLASELVATNDLLLGLYTAWQWPKHADGFEEVRQGRASRLRVATDARLAAVRDHDGTIFVDPPGPPDPWIVDALHGKFGQGVRSRETTGLECDIIVRASDADESAYLLVLPTERSATTADLKLADALFTVVDGITGLARVHQRETELAIVDSEASAAAELANLALPAHTPVLPRLELAARCEPARLGGGDFYTWQETSEGDLAFAVGDVTGKGLPAALLMSMMCESVRGSVRRGTGDDPAKLLREVSLNRNAYLERVERFVTVVMGRWCADRSVLQLANAGHSPVVIRTQDGLTTVPATCPPLGVLDDIQPDLVELPLHPGDLLVIGTDGLTEQEDERGVQFGEDAFKECVAGWTGSPAELIDTLFTSVSAHGTVASDDRTALALRLLGATDEV